MRRRVLSMIAVPKQMHSTKPLMPSHGMAFAPTLACMHPASARAALGPEVFPCTCCHLGWRPLQCLLLPQCALPSCRHP